MKTFAGILLGQIVFATLAVGYLIQCRRQDKKKKQDRLADSCIRQKRADYLRNYGVVDCETKRKL